MLLGNYSTLNRNTVTHAGTAFTNPHAVFKATAFNRYYTPDTAQSGRSLAAWYSGYRVGAEGGAAWWLPLKAGELSAVNSTQGVGAMTVTGVLGLNAEGASAGVASLTATGELVVSGSAALAGVGAMTGEVNAALVGEAAAAGVGAMSGTLTATGAGGSAPAGVGSVSGTLTATGALASDIIVTGDALTTANVGSAVWGSDAGDGVYTYAQVLRIIAAVTAGKASGGPGSPVFRNLADTRDVLTGTADSSGNRTAATYNP